MSQDGDLEIGEGHLSRTKQQHEISIPISNRIDLSHLNVRDSLDHDLIGDFNISDRMNSQEQNSLPLRSQGEFESEIREQMSEVLLNISLWERHSKTIERFLQYAVYYFYCQFILSVLELGLKWHTPYTKPYLGCVLFQYIVNIMTTINLRQQNLKRIKFFDQLLLIQHSSQVGQIELFVGYLRVRNDYELNTSFYSVWQVIEKANQNKMIFNECLVVLIWVFGGFQMFLNSKRIDTWFLVLQLGIGWSFIGAIALIGSLICIILPIACIYISFKDRLSRRRRNTNLQKINDSATKYGSLQITSYQPCYICLDEYAAEDIVVYLPCQTPHLFHRECLEPWLVENEFCPVCRTLIQ